MASFGSLKSTIFGRQERKEQYQAHILGLNAYDRHKKFIKDYVDFYGKDISTEEKLPVKTDKDTLKEGYRFIRSEEDDLDPSWEQRLVKRYYAKLFKEYCLADMSQYRKGKIRFRNPRRQPGVPDVAVDYTGVPDGTNMVRSFEHQQRKSLSHLSQDEIKFVIGLRWRTEKEVISGKGQFVCGNKHCDEKDGLASYEVNFSYLEAGENKQALVKLVTCERCAKKLNYKKQKEKEQLKRDEKEMLRRKRERSASDDDMPSEYERSKARRKGIKTSNSSEDKADDSENFDEFLKGMFL